VERKKFLALAIVGVFILTSAGMTQAGGWMHKPSEGRKSMEQASGIPAPEFWTDDYSEGGAPAEFWGPVETGALPGSDASPQGSESGVDLDQPVNFDEANY
jgi:hypothetical protein